jgi:rod shape-determining protein MreD
MKSIFKNLLVSLILILIQTTVLRLISIESITPDLLAIWIVYIAIKEGQFSATLWGFGTGFFLDLVSGNFIGLSALTKTILGFLAGYFYGENKVHMILSSYRFPLIVFITTLVHNTIYFALFTRGTDMSLVSAVGEVGLATALYTTTLSLLPMFVYARRHVV